ncbi:glycine-rich RNA-binding protein 2-like [Panicum virgatum]|uniref:glycine-rich RNA-binding protein 2-like n=1 Tax=Panicum virgatum TaxID=38727 RepID=UPI0019D5457F|nr:glycine-rich RNA-binding protein 2-like [Panicum virgatum]
MSLGSSSTAVLEPEAQAPGVSLKIGRTLSMRGITLCRWKFAMTAVAINPLRSRRSSASVQSILNYITGWPATIADGRKGTRVGEASAAEFGDGADGEGNCTAGGSDGGAALAAAEAVTGARQEAEIGGDGGGRAGGGGGGASREQSGGVRGPRGRRLVRGRTVVGLCWL